MNSNRVEFLQSFRFRVHVDGKQMGLARVGEIEILTERNGNIRPHPVVLEAAPQVNKIGIAALVHGGRRHEVVMEELTRVGDVGRIIRLRGCRFRHYRMDPHDARDPGKVTIERVTIHPKRVEFRAPPPPPLFEMGGVNVPGLHEALMAVGADPKACTTREIADALRKLGWDAEAVNGTTITTGRRIVDKGSPPVSGVVAEGRKLAEEVGRNGHVATKEEVPS